MEMKITVCSSVFDYDSIRQHEKFRVPSQETAKYRILLNNKNIGKHMYFYIANGRTPRTTALGKWFLLDSAAW